MTSPARVPLIVALLSAVVACTGTSTASASARAHERAKAACKAYTSVSGMTGAEGLRRFELGARDAKTAARLDARWLAFAKAWNTWVSYNQGVQAGRSPSSATGLQAGRDVARQCGSLLGLEGS